MMSERNPVSTERRDASEAATSRSGLAAGGEPRRLHALVLANRLPFPLDDGWTVRTFHVVRAIARHARVTLLVFRRTEDEPRIEAAAAALGPAVRLDTVAAPRPYTLANLVRGLVTRVPVHVWNQESPELRAAAQQVLARDPPDVLIVESTFLARYLDPGPRDLPRIIDTHNIDSVTFGRYVRSLRGPKRWYAAATARRLALLEAASYGTADAVWVCSDVERDLAKRMAPGAHVTTIPNGVDTEAYRPRGESAHGNRLLFFGKLDYFPNVDGLAWFAREILPRLLAERPDLVVHVVGASATRDVVELANAHPAIRLVGRVDDVPATLAAAATIVVPLRVGGGTRLKILEALAAARPVVTTTIGAEGLPVEHGRHLLVADAPDEFARAVLAVLADAGLASRLGEDGRRLAREQFDWSHIAERVGHEIARIVHT